MQWERITKSRTQIQGVHLPFQGLPEALPRAWQCAPGNTSTPTTEQAASGASKCTVTIRNSNIHPQFQHLMASYISHFHSVQLKTLLKVSNVTKERLPTLPKYIRNGKNGLCYTYILGKCQGKRCGKSPEGHAPVGDITDTFA